MKKYYIGLSLVAAIVTFLGWTSYSYPNGAPAGYSGAPGETTCNNSSCHNNTENTNNTGANNNTLLLNDSIPVHYVPGRTYSVNLRVNGAGAKRGFEITCLNAAGASVGSLTAGTNSQLTSTTVAGNSRQYLTQTRTLTSTTSNLFFDWTAPATNVGTVTFHCAGFAGSSRFNGIVTKTSWALTPLVTSTVPSIEVQNLNIFPNPVVNAAKISFSIEKPTTVIVNLFTLDGKVISEISNGEQGAGNHEMQFEFPKNVPAGVYFIQVKAGAKTAIHRVIKA